MKQQPNELMIIAKRNQKKDQKRLILDRKYSKMLGLRKEKLDYKKARELERYEKKRKKLMEIELHNLTHKRQRKEPVDKTIGTRKKKALREIQRYAKLSRAIRSTEGPMIFLVDKQKRVPLNRNVHGGHCFGQRNHPGLAFDIDNIRPIHYITNRTQNDQDAEWIKNLPRDIQDYLNIKKDDKSIKRSMRDRKFYEAIIEKYKELNRIEEKRLGILSTKKIDAGTK